MFDVCSDSKNSNTCLESVKKVLSVENKRNNSGNLVEYKKYLEIYNDSVDKSFQGTTEMIQSGSQSPSSFTNPQSPIVKCHFLTKLDFRNPLSFDEINAHMSKVKSKQSRFTKVALDLTNKIELLQEIYGSSDYDRFRIKNKIIQCSLDIDGPQKIITKLLSKLENPNYERTLHPAYLEDLGLGEHMLSYEMPQPQEPVVMETETLEQQNCEIVEEPYPEHPCEELPGVTDITLTDEDLFLEHDGNMYIRVDDVNYHLITSMTEDGTSVMTDTGYEVILPPGTQLPMALASAATQEEEAPLEETWMDQYALSHQQQEQQQPAQSNNPNSRSSKLLSALTQPYDSLPVSPIQQQQYTRQPHQYLQQQQQQYMHQPQQQYVQQPQQQFIQSQQPHHNHQPFVPLPHMGHPSSNNKIPEYISLPQRPAPIIPFTLSSQLHTPELSISMTDNDRELMLTFDNAKKHLPQQSPQCYQIYTYSSSGVSKQQQPGQQHEQWTLLGQVGACQLPMFCTISIPATGPALKHYFAIRSVDDLGRFSDWSNVVQVEVAQ